jgi:hypothetical protein
MAKTYKPGEVVEVEASQVDENGQCIMEVTAKFFGFNRDQANSASAQAIADMLEGSKRFANVQGPIAK